MTKNKIQKIILKEPMPLTGKGYSRMKEMELGKIGIYSLVKNSIGVDVKLKYGNEDIKGLVPYSNIGYIIYGSEHSRHDTCAKSSGDDNGGKGKGTSGVLPGTIKCTQ